MPAANYDFEIEQGTDYDKSLVWRDSTGNLVNLTGYTARMQLRPSVSSDTVLLDLTTENGGITLGGATGEITLHFTEANTSPLVKGGVFDLEMIIGGKVKRLVQGSITVSREVTRNV